MSSILVKATTGASYGFRSICIGPKYILRTVKPGCLLGSDRPDTCGPLSET